MRGESEQKQYEIAPVRKLPVRDDEGSMSAGRRARFGGACHGAATVAATAGHGPGSQGGAGAVEAGSVSQAGRYAFQLVSHVHHQLALPAVCDSYVTKQPSRPGKPKWVSPAQVHEPSPRPSAKVNHITNQPKSTT